MDASITNAIEAWSQNPELYRLDNISLFVSGSNWDDKHFNAFHIIPLFDEDIFSDMIDISSQELEAFRLLWIMSRDDIYDDNWESFYKASDRVSNIYKSNITAIMTVLINLIDRRRSTDSDLSHTSDEDKQESLTRSLSSVICSSFLKMTRFHQKQYPSWDLIDCSYVISVLRNQFKAKVVPDGSIVYKLDKHNVIHHIWIETKTLGFAPAREGYEKTIPQKAAECLALAQRQWNPNIIRDHEVFGIEFSHRFVSFWRARVSHEYLRQLQISPSIPPQHYVIMRRSPVLDLIEQKDRCTFTKWFLTLLKTLNENPIGKPHSV